MNDWPTNVHLPGGESPQALTPVQLELVQLPSEARIFLEGPAGTGKTHAAVERLLNFMSAGVPAEQILLLLPHRPLAGPYLAALTHPGVTGGGQVTITTIAGLAQRAVEHYWPQVAEAAGFAQPEQPPVFLNHESAQYFLGRLIGPRLEDELFVSLNLERNRIYSQILDNLARAALSRFPYTDIGERLAQAWVGSPDRKRLYSDLQTSASVFRQYCLAHNLLDFSLQMDVFMQYVWPRADYRQELFSQYPYLFVDNLEEDTGLAHDLLVEWLPACRGALLVFDRQAGYRIQLGADPRSNYQLREHCAEQRFFGESLVASPAVETLANRMRQAIAPLPSPNVLELPEEWDWLPEADEPNPRAALTFTTQRYFPQMLDWVASDVARLVIDAGIPANEIVLLAPFLSDALRFSLTSRLEALDIPVRSQRPSRPLTAEPVVQSLLNLALLALPTWLDPDLALLPPNRFDIAHTLTQTIGGLDPVRAQLLAEIVYRLQDGRPQLSSFERIRPDMQERITIEAGERYERMRLWLEEETPPWIASDIEEAPELALDEFFQRLFEEVLAQPGFGFSDDFDAAAAAANLVDSARNFRLVAGPALGWNATHLALEYIHVLRSGLLPAQYLRTWEQPEEEAVLIAPAHTYLLTNRPVQYQFWLDVGSRSWGAGWQQPLINYYVLNRHWPPGRPWTDADELSAGRNELVRQVLGLLRRCRHQVYLGVSELSESGYEQRGPLLLAFQRVLQQVPGARLEAQA